MFLYKHWTESPVYITPNLPIYMGIFVFFIETEVSLSFFYKHQNIHLLCQETRKHQTRYFHS